MKRRIISLLVALSAALVVVSCSIKEDRSSCPCYLTLRFDELSESDGSGSGLVTVHTDRIISQKQIMVHDYFGSGYEIVVPRRHVTVSCVSGLQEEDWYSDSLFVREGKEWGKIMLASESLDCKDDEYVLPMHFTKEFCTVTIEILGIPEEELPSWKMRIKAFSCGIRMAERMPLSGPYMVEADRDGNDPIYSVRVPRQEGYSMVLELADADGAISCMDLGCLIQARGYDWTRADLDDIYVVVDYAHALVSVEIKRWNVNDVDERI